MEATFLGFVRAVSSLSILLAMLFRLFRPGRLVHALTKFSILACSSTAKCRLRTPTTSSWPHSNSRWLYVSPSSWPHSQHAPMRPPFLSTTSGGVENVHEPKKGEIRQRVIQIGAGETMSGQDAQAFREQRSVPFRFPVVDRLIDRFLEISQRQGLISFSFPSYSFSFPRSHCSFSFTTLLQKKKKRSCQPTVDFFKRIERFVPGQLDSEFLNHFPSFHEEWQLMLLGHLVRSNGSFILRPSGEPSRHRHQSSELH